MNSVFKKILFIILLMAAVNGFSQQQILSKNATVSILTCDLGNESYSLFGHTAIRITDIENQIDVVYNYGAFDFATPNFVAKFTKGDLQYFVVAHSFTDFINQYQYEKRSVYEQELLFSGVYKQKLFDALNKTLQSDDRFYTYKFIDQNCTTMVVDIINWTLNLKVIEKKDKTTITYRSILFPYFNGHFYEQLGTSIIFGKKVDQLGKKIFLPFDLLQSLKTETFNSQPLAKATVTLIAFEKQTQTSWWNTIYTYLFVLGFILLINKIKIDFIYLTIIGIIGVFFASVGFYSFHQELSANYNVLLFNPVLLVMLYFYGIKNKKWIYKLALFNLFCLLVYVVILINKAYLLIVLPLIITNGVVLIKLAIQNKKPISIII
ncbi:DUF4105 domain-containing protein [Flavobacterium sp.]|uniref:lipoprotein N-acyltransferase Lnb domain-containing protein n=1 Tax=Flavobacterium sp. TaxID=239 RepID=UPI00286C0F6D|nr:DUF4105 domain-containing protein [Flavobacterium sp.]